MQKENLESLDHPNVKMFICGPTVYDYSHLGHARIFIVYDMIARYLKAKGYKPFVLLNLTDIDAKVFDRAKKESLDYESVIKKYKEELQKDLALINVESISAFALGTDYVEYMKDNVTKLLDYGYAYSANGNIYFDAMKIEGYGALSHQTVEDMTMRRIDLAPNKKNQFDFLVWNGKDRFDVTWESDFGAGIPWWHIQDTSIAMSVFKAPYDIHGGARELLYPHHEAHLAQMKALLKNVRPIKYWVHTGILKINDQKMSKSLSNTISIRDTVLKYGSDALRLYILSKPYREDITFDENELAGHVNTVNLIQNAVRILNRTANDTLDGKTFVDKFYKAMDDDFDTPTALLALIELCRNVVEGNTHANKMLNSEVDKMLGIFGLTLV